MTRTAEQKETRREEYVQLCREKQASVNRREAERIAGLHKRAIVWGDEGDELI